MDMFSTLEQEKIDLALSEFVKLLTPISLMSLDSKVNFINEARARLHEISPFNSEPVDFVRWVKNPLVHANDYNPNSVAPPEMELLRLSISSDGYTQPIVAMPDDQQTYEVIDGFHRHRVGKECEDIQGRVHGYLPLVEIKSSRREKSDRMAATIRHNRARGKHKVEAMSDIVIELKRRNWSDEKIAKELGMEPDEVLRLCQISGLAEIFSDREFSQAWEVEGHVTEDDFEVSEDEEFMPEELREKKVVNTSDRVFHTYDKWECHKAGFYNTTVKGKTKAELHEEYRQLLTDENEFRTALAYIITEWPNSCEHYLGNSAMNRIAWLGQASACFSRGVPSDFRGGWQLLTEEQQNKANLIALEYLNRWLVSQGKPEVTLEDGLANGRQSEIY